MDEKFYLKETCDIFGVAPSKILFWEKKGLLRIERDENNDYRQFTFPDHANLSDILFYKKLGLSLTEIKQLHNMDLDTFSRTLFLSKKRSEEKMQAIIATQREIDKRLRIIHTIYALQQAGFQVADIPVKGVIPLYDVDSLQYQALLLDLENFTAILDLADGDSPEAADFTYHFGLIVPDCENYKTLLFQPENPALPYVRFLLQVPYERSFERFDLSGYLHKINAQFGPADKIICKYLLTAVDKKDETLYDYYDAYAQLRG